MANVEPIDPLLNFLLGFRLMGNPRPPGMLKVARPFNIKVDGCTGCNYFHDHCPWVFRVLNPVASSRYREPNTPRFCREVEVLNLRLRIRHDEGQQRASDNSNQKLARLCAHCVSVS
jgi:hypothetical protein